MGDAKKQLHTRGDVRAVYGACGQAENSNSRKRALAAAAYLAMLAEQVRNGTVVAFDVAWSGADAIEVQIRTPQPASYVHCDMNFDADSVHCEPWRSK